MIEEETLTLALDDAAGQSQQVIKYTIRGLEESEVDRWTEFCASIFSYKANPPPPSYFARHYYNDPRRQAALIRVAICEETSEIVSSCRIFCKTISIGGDNNTARVGAKSPLLEAGGIGEVCTLPSHRKRGLSKALLQNAIEIMASQCKMQVTLLHAAPAFFPVYQKSGNYQNVLSRWSLVTVKADLLLVDEPSNNTRLASFPSDTSRLMELHQRFSEQRFCGCIIRTEQYWNEYLAKELDGSLFVLQKAEDDTPVVAWISLRQRSSDRWQVRDFGCDLTMTTLEERQDGLRRLLGTALRGKFDTDDEKNSDVDVHLPTFLVQDFELVTVPWSGDVREENDEGWMYRTLDDSDVSMVERSRSAPHLVWPADSF